MNIRFQEVNAIRVQEWFKNRENFSHSPLNIVVKEIYIQTCLDNSTNISYPVVLVVCFMIRSIDPVYDVKSTVCTK